MPKFKTKLGEKMGSFSLRFLISTAVVYGAHAFVLPTVHSHRAFSRIAAKSPFQLPDFAAMFGGGGKRTPTGSGSSSIGKDDLVAVASSEDIRAHTHF